MAAEHAHEHGHGHVHPTSHYVKIWGILLVLLVVSVVGPELNLGTYFTLFTAFGIAVVKAGLVIKFFMHIDAELKMIWYILVGSLVLMGLFFFGVAADVRNHEGTRWVNVAAKAEVARGMAAGEAKAAHGDDHGDGH